MNQQVLLQMKHITFATTVYTTPSPYFTEEMKKQLTLRDCNSRPEMPLVFLRRFPLSTSEILQVMCDVSQTASKAPALKKTIL